ncbi:MAG TPA: MotA/TolQ/ExbB proton channel family protein [Polyangia bacterium]|nr:MotA/TolQ/ExbB proton channel family protein [Polyangia bacterium]
MNSASVLMQKLVFVAQLASSAVLYILLGLSVISIGVVIERWWFFRKRRVDIDQLSDELRRLLAKKDVAGARKALVASPSVEAAIVLEALDWWDEGPDAVEQILVRATRSRRKRFEAGLLFLGTLGNNAPFVGLFGTVLGIVTAFRELGTAQMGAMGNVMSGIAEALISTAVGILVALPAVIFYNVFQKKGADVEEQAGALGNVVIASMRAGKEGSNGTRHKRDTSKVATTSPTSTAEVETRRPEAEA